MLTCRISVFHQPQEQWEVDLKDLESKIDSRTKLIVITDPSNPCGSVFSEQHLRDLLCLVAKFRIVVLADVVYEDMTFDNTKSHRVTDFAKDVPVLMCGSIAKRYVVPGWRCGWVVVFDRKRILEKAVSCFVSVRIAQLKTPLLFLAGCC